MSKLLNLIVTLVALTFISKSIFPATRAFKGLKLFAPISVITSFVPLLKNLNVNGIAETSIASKPPVEFILLNPLSPPPAKSIETKVILFS